jgi:sporulation protein YlmC with PRC-barrel domain
LKVHETPRAFPGWSCKRGLKSQKPKKEINMRAFLLTGAALIVLSQAAMAQSPNPAQPGQPQANATQNDNGNATPSQQHLRANLKSVLEKAGYKDIRVAPTSFMIHARDNDGNPVVMAISPDSFSEVADVYTGSTAGANGNPDATTGTANNNAAAGSGTFVSIPENDELSSKVVGLDIYNTDNKDIGQIKDIALNQNGRSQAYIVSVGGFLGLGEHYIAVNPSAVKITYGDQDKKWHASMNASADQLKAAPEFKYSGRWQSNRT